MQTLNSIENFFQQTQIGREPVLIKYPRGLSNKVKDQVISVQDQCKVDNQNKKPIEQYNELAIKCQSLQINHSASKKSQTISSRHSRQITNHNNKEFSMMSEIKVITQFSPADNSEHVVCFEPSNVSSVMLEQSLRSDLRVWEQICDVDRSVVCEVERGFQDIDNQIQQLAGQFDVCFSLQQRADAQLQEYWQFVRGTTFTKFSRRNPKKTMMRLVYYCPYLEALCWRSPSARQATNKQVIPIQSILCVHTNAKRYKANVKKGFQLKEGFDAECFLAIEAKKGVTLELLASDQKTRNMFSRVLEQLMANSGKVTGGGITDSNFLMTQHGQDVNQIRRNLDTTKRYFSIAVEKLKQSFLTTAQMMLQQEQQKRGQLKREQKNIMKQNKATLEELIYKNEHLQKLLHQEHKRLNSEQQQVNNKYSENQSGVELMKLNQIIHSIVALNGECSMQNESQIGGQVSKSGFQDSLILLDQLREQMEQGQQTELYLRGQIQDLDSHISEQSQIIRQINVEREQLLLSNEELACKLDEVHQQINQKEKQFKDVLQEMRQLQGKVQVMLKAQQQQQQQQQYEMNENENEQLRNENNSLKQIIQQKLGSLKTQMIQEEQENARLIAGMSVVLCFLCVPNELNQSADVVMRSMCNQIPRLGSHSKQGNDWMRSPSTADSLNSITDEDRVLSDIAQQLDKKITSYLQKKEFRDIFLEHVNTGMVPLRYQCLNMSNIIQLNKLTLLLEQNHYQQDNQMQSPTTSYRVKEIQNPIQGYSNRIKNKFSQQY